MTLTEGGYDLLQAIDGEDALDILANRDVDLILLDDTMQRLNGAVF